jgi:cell division protein FtsL
MQRSFRLTRILVSTLLVLSVVFYCVSKTCVNSWNISLSMEEDQLSQEIAKKEQTVEELQNEVNTLQEKGRLLGMLDNQVSDNENNIYVMDD